MHLLALILGAAMLHQVSPLSCNRCIPPNMENCQVAECVSRTYKCGALRFTTFIGDLRIDETQMRACVPPEECVENSVNFGTTRIVMTSRCCSTDQCNTEQAPAADVATRNGKKCFHCIGKDCTATAHCVGTEDHCISKTVDRGKGVEVSKGCATKEVCTSMNNPHLRSAIGGEIKCCTGNFCNSASSTSVSLLLLAAPLFSLVMFS